MLTRRNLTAIVYVIGQIFVATWYSYQIVAKEIHPTLSTWLIFFVGSSIGLTTYLRAEGKRDVVKNIANTTDVAFTALVSVLLLLTGVRLELNVFELTCLCIAGAIVLYYITSRKAGGSYIAINTLMAVAYFPTLFHLWNSQRNPESFVMWGFSWFGAVIACYNPVREKDWLAALYAIRTLTLVSVVLLLMVWLSLR